MSRTAGPVHAALLHRDRQGANRIVPSSVLRPDVQERLRAALGLSPREFRIALCMMDGLSEAGTASCLGCSPHTVNSHLRRIHRKLGVTSRVGIVAQLFVAFAEMECR